jgi:hypothetical protein
LGIHVKHTYLWWSNINSNILNIKRIILAAVCRQLRWANSNWVPNHKRSKLESWLRPFLLTLHVLNRWSNLCSNQWLNRANNPTVNTPNIVRVFRCNFFDVNWLGTAEIMSGLQIIWIIIDQHLINVSNFLENSKVSKLQLVPLGKP